jgi:hypothetical protein
VPRGPRRRRDTLRRLLAGTATFFLRRPARRRLLAALTLAAEQRCDEAATRAVGDRLRFVEVLRKVERLLQAPPAARASVAAPYGGDEPARVPLVHDHLHTPEVHHRHDHGRPRS